LVKQLEALFNLENLKTNRYLIKQANINFEIPMMAIYEERKIKAISSNRDLINQALKKVDKIEVLKNGYIKPKYESKRDKIIVKHIAYQEEPKFTQFLLQLPDYKECGIEGHIPRYDNRLQTVTIECKDNTAAKTLFNTLNNTKFQDNSIDCLLNEENFYIACLDNIKRAPMSNYGPPPQSAPYMKYNQQQYMPPQFNQQFMFGAYNPYAMNQVYQQPIFQPYSQPRQNFNYSYPRRYNNYNINNSNEVSNNYNNNYGGKPRFYKKDYNNKNSNYQGNGKQYNNQGQKNPKELNFDPTNFPPLSE